METLFLIVLPLFLIILLGMAARRARILSKDAVPYLSDFFFRISIPALLIHSLSQQPLSEIATHWKFFALFAGLTLAIFIATMLLSHLLFPRNNWQHHVFFGMLSCWLNAAMLALPILYTAFGHTGTIYGVLANLAILLVFAPIALLSLEATDGSGAGAATIIGETVVKMARNPIIIGTAVGIFFSATGLSIPRVLNATLKTLAASAAPIALFAVGLDINFAALRHNMLAVAMLSAIKLLVMPLAAIALGLYFKLPPVSAVSLVVCAAIPTGKSVFGIAHERKLCEGETSAVIALTGIIAIFSVVLFLAIAHHIWHVKFAI